MSIQIRMQALLPSLPPSAVKIAQYIIEHPHDVVNASSQSLAALAGVSQSAVSKFFQKAGFSSYTNFKIELSEELGRKRSQATQQLHNDISLDDPMNIVMQKLLNEKVNAVEQTLLALDQHFFKDLIDIIYRAPRIQIVGVGGSALVGKDFAMKLLKIGMAAISEFDIHTQIVTATALTSNDVQIVISHSGETRDVNFAAEQAIKSGATVIALTNVSHSSLRSIATYSIDTIADESRWRSSSISSRDAQMAVIDLMFMRLIQLKGEKAENLIKSGAQIINTVSRNR
ncbi:SIS domain-containing protein [Vibrio sp.]|nr:SIS domain-containing protein [Vibrio sp.]